MRGDWKYRYDEVLKKESLLQTVNKQLEKAQVRLKQAGEQRAAAEKVLKSETRDVERLEKASLTNLLYTVLGRKIEKLEKEETEAIQARIRAEETRLAEEELARMTAELEQRRSSLLGWEEEAASLLQEKEEWLRSRSEDFRLQLNRLYEAKRQALSEIKELDEALQAGYELVESLEEAENLLRSAKSWGTYDMFGGGVIATHLKRSKANEAMEQIEYAQGLMSRFKRELEDVGGTAEMNLNYNGFLGFADYFMDGFIFDWIVQGRISDLKDAVSENIDRLRQLLHALRQKYEARLTDEAELTLDIHLLIERS
ncbi:hypothetical protein [Paenibacillus sp. GbtcB18]|uniref:hypothetical protein n=1 Tax=Paenibacillus sp. GbtcB18 TaxID=2824763 RepID=UPI001C30888D|nr:hypothetical protein [Paenibacillus sp. GbtcB18]